MCVFASSLKLSVIMRAQAQRTRETTGGEKNKTRQERLNGPTYETRAEIKKVEGPKRVRVRDRNSVRKIKVEGSGMSQPHTSTVYAQRGLRSRQKHRNKTLERTRVS